MKQSKKTANITILKGFISHRTKDSITIFDPEKSVLHVFNDTAAFIFDRLKRKENLNNIVKGLVKNFEVSEEKAETDVNNFIELIVSKGLAKREHI